MLTVRLSCDAVELTLADDKSEELLPNLLLLHFLSSLLLLMPLKLRRSQPDIFAKDGMATSAVRYW